MWLWEGELHAVGFRRRSRWYWQAQQRFGVPPNAYVSLFAGAQYRVAAAGKRSGLQRVEASTFHVTFRLGVDNIHFYYHEVGTGEWEPGGRTSGEEIRRYGLEPAELRDQADAVACRVVAAFGGVLWPRHAGTKGR